MIHIGKLTDYAMLIMSQLAKEPTTTLSTTNLAEVLHLSAPTVSKIMKLLSEANLVNSMRGAVGGYHLARDATTISVAEVIAAMEGEIAMTECCEIDSRCAINAICTMRENWRKINKIVYTLLSGVSILDMTGPICLKRSIAGLTHDK